MDSRPATVGVFGVAFAVGAAAELLLFASDFASTGEAPAILLAMCVPGMLLVFPMILGVVDLLGNGWLAASFLAGVNGLLYGAVLAGVWKAYRAVRRNWKRRS